MKALQRFDDIDLDDWTQDVNRAPAAPTPRIVNGTYTLIFPTEEYRTFRIHTKKKTAKFAPGQRVLSMLIGADNTKDYRPFAFVDDSGFRIWKKHKDSAMAGYCPILWKLATGGEVEGYEIRVAGTCIVCNRILTTPASILAGIGAHCAEMLARGN